MWRLSLSTPFGGVFPACYYIFWHLRGMYLFSVFKWVWGGWWHYINVAVVCFWTVLLFTLWFCLLLTYLLITKQSATTQSSPVNSQPLCSNYKHVSDNSWTFFLIKWVLFQKLFISVNLWNYPEMFENGGLLLAYLLDRYLSWKWRFVKPPIMQKSRRYAAFPNPNPQLVLRMLYPGNQSISTPFSCIL